MLRQILRSKIRNLTVTGKELYYEGSITLDEDLLQKADMLPGEKVQVLNTNNGSRMETYIINGGHNTGKVILNGPAARLGEVGDQVMVLSYALADDVEAAELVPRLVEVDSDNVAIEK